MKRRFGIQEMLEFTVKKVAQNLALVEYPKLSGASDINLNLLANHLLQVSNSVINVNIFVNNRPIQIVDLGMGGQGRDYHMEQHPHGHQGIIEGSPPSHPGHDDHHPDLHGGSMDDQLNELYKMLEHYDTELEEIHTESERMVQEYHD